MKLLFKIWEIIGASKKLTSWLFIILTIIYIIWKSYVLWTPSPDDDNLPDEMRDAVLEMVDKSSLVICEDMNDA